MPLSISLISMSKWLGEIEPTELRQQMYAAQEQINKFEKTCAFTKNSTEILILNYTGGIWDG